MHKAKMHFAKETGAENKQEKISSNKFTIFIQALYHIFTLLLSIKLHS